MSSEEELLAFYHWETQLRGWDYAEYPIGIEPSLESPLEAAKPQIDDGRFRLKDLFKPRQEVQVEPEPIVHDFGPEIRLRIALRLKPDGLVEDESFKQFLLLASKTTFPLVFEIIGSEKEIHLSFVIAQEDESYFLTLFKSYFPNLLGEIEEIDQSFYLGKPPAIIDFGLDEEVMFPIGVQERNTSDPYAGILGVMAYAKAGVECSLRITFNQAKAPWRKTLVSNLYTVTGKPFFGGDEKLYSGFNEKSASPFVFARVQLVVFGKNQDGISETAYQAISAMELFSKHGGNRLIPLSNQGIKEDGHNLAAAKYLSFRHGMLLSISELFSLVHLPKASISLPQLWGREERASWPVPTTFTGLEYTLGDNVHDRETKQVTVDDEARLRHTHIIGATGVGKSTFIISQALNDAQAGNGFSVIDPHGDLVEDILAMLPEYRLKDVILLDPSDHDFPIGLNLLEASSEIEKIILRSDLVSVFARMNTSWGDQMNTILGMAIGAFFEREEKGTLLELYQFLSNKEFREGVLKYVKDPLLQSYWRNDFPQLRKGALAPLTSRLSSFLGQKTIRNMMAIKDGLSFGDILAERKILLVKLSQGSIGLENSSLLGSLILSKHYQAGLARQELDQNKRHPHYIYIDEFHNFLSDSMPSLLTGIRKYGLGLILAHQNLEQLKGEHAILETLLANAYTRICFRLGEANAAILQKGFDHFEAEDFQNLGRGEAIVRFGRSIDDCSLTIQAPSSFPEKVENNRQGAREQTRRAFASSLKEVNEIVSNVFKVSEGHSIKSQTTEKSREPVKKEEVEADENKPKVAQATLVKEVLETSDFEKKKEEYHSKEVKRINDRTHRYFQESIKSYANELGWKATLEQSLSDVRVDVMLTQNKSSIAVQVCVSNTPKYELESVFRILTISDAQVFLVAKNSQKLAKLKRVFCGSEMDPKRVFFGEEMEFKQFLLDSTRIEPTVKTVDGFRVKVKYHDADDHDSRMNEIRRNINKRHDETK